MDQNNRPSHIVFEGEEFQRSARSFNSEKSGMIQWVIKYSGGLVKNEKQASYVLIGFVVLVIIISLFLIFGGGSGGSNRIPLTPEQRSFLEKVHGL